MAEQAALRALGRSTTSSSAEVLMHGLQGRNDVRLLYRGQATLSNVLREASRFRHRIVRMIYRHFGCLRLHLRVEGSSRVRKTAQPSVTQGTAGLCRCSRRSFTCRLPTDYMFSLCCTKNRAFTFASAEDVHSTLRVARLCSASWHAPRLCHPVTPHQDHTSIVAKSGTEEAV